LAFNSPGSIVRSSISGCRPLDPGSNPGLGAISLSDWAYFVLTALFGRAFKKILCQVKVNNNGLRKLKWRTHLKIRESGMPKEEEWNKFFDPIEALKLLGLSSSVVNVADFGCGYGTFTIPAAQIISGKIYAFDIEPEMTKVVERKAKNLNLGNVKAIVRDFVTKGSGLEDESVDYVFLFNILHFEKPESLLKESYRILKPDGKVGIIHWNYDPTTPRGPPMTIRPRPEQCRRWAESVGFIFEQKFDLKPYHYGLVLHK
jgi:SAM-dependent methyltransferase